ncbi:MAG: helix-turn-helix domain-containing protein [Nanoarchaeota archaeon]|nr:helix-turn-helix domain-containing protein [Nanoarchaeota archaeon]
MEIYNLTRGTDDKPYQMTAQEAAKFLGIGKKTVYNYLHKSDISNQ